MFGAEMLDLLCTAHHLSTIREMDLFIGGVMWAAFSAGLVWMLYLALEPYMRRRWPQSMVTSSRLLGGRFRHPLVGGHVLAGVAMGIGGSMCFFLERLALEHYRSFSIFTRMLDSVLDARRMTGAMLSVLIQVGIGVGLVVVFLFFLLRVLLRRQWLVAAVFILLFSGVNGLQFSGHPEIGVLFEALAALFVLACMLCFGVLTIALFCFVGEMLTDFPLTTDLSAWYTGSTVFAVAIVLALTAYAFHTAVAGRPLFKAGFLDTD